MTLNSQKSQSVTAHVVEPKQKQKKKNSKSDVTRCPQQALLCNIATLLLEKPQCNYTKYSVEKVFAAGVWHDFCVKTATGKPGMRITLCRVEVKALKAGWDLNLFVTALVFS